jgi:hypothetical protein
VVLSLYVHALVFSNKSTRLLMVAFLVDLTVFCVRPNFVLLPFAIYILHWVGGIKEYRKTLLVIVSIYFLLVQTYCFANFIRYGFWNVTNVGRINTLGKLAQYGYFSRGYDPANYPKVLNDLYVANKALGFTNNPWDMLHSISNTYDASKVEGLDVGENYLLQANMADIAIKSVLLIPAVLSAPPVYYGNSNIPLDFLSGFAQFFRNSRIFALLFGVVLAVVAMVRKNWGMVWKLSLVLCCCVYGLLITVVYAYSEYYRLLVPFEFLLNALVLLPLVWGLQLLMVWVNGKRKKEPAKSVEN